MQRHDMKMDHIEDKDLQSCDLYPRFDDQVKRQLLHHTKFQHKSDILMGYKCDVCNIIFKLKIALNKHNQKLHDAKWKCPKCRKIFDAKKFKNCNKCDICNVSLVKFQDSVIKKPNNALRVLNQERKKTNFNGQALKNGVINHSDSVLEQVNQWNVTLDVTQDEIVTSNKKTVQLRKKIKLFFKELCSLSTKCVTSTPIKTNKAFNFENTLTNNEIIYIDDDEDEVNAENEASNLNVSGCMNSNLTSICDETEKHIVHKVYIDENENEKKIIPKATCKKVEGKPSKKIRKKINGSKSRSPKQSNNKSKLDLNLNKKSKSKNLSENMHSKRNNSLKIENYILPSVKQNTTANCNKNKKLTKQNDDLNNFLFNCGENDGERITFETITPTSAAAKTEILNWRREFDDVKSDNSSKKRRKLFNLTTSIDTDTADSSYEVEGCTDIEILNPYTINKQLRGSKRKIIKSKSFEVQRIIKNLTINENINQDIANIDEMLHKPSSGINKKDNTKANQKEKSNLTEYLTTIGAKNDVGCKSMIENKLCNRENDAKKGIENRTNVSNDLCVKNISELVDITRDGSGCGGRKYNRQLRTSVFRCSQCDFLFATNSLMQKHVFNFHVNIQGKQK